jgi:Zn-finger nucleic acid-binding protein
MESDVTWACPRCRTRMVAGTTKILSSWHCPTCEFDFVTGEALAAYLPTVSGFQKLMATAAGAPPSVRPLHCPQCRADSFRVLRAGGAEVDICPKCVGVALDPGELRTFKSIGNDGTKRAVAAVDVIYGLEGLAQLLSLFM